MSRAGAAWVFASSNRGKLAEASALLEACGISVLAQQAFGIEPPPESGRTFVENALLKARHAAALSGRPTIADDSGLCVAALGGGPGLHSARYAGPDATDAANVEKLLEALAGLPAAARTAYFVCVVVALRASDDPDPYLAVGHWHGSITTAPRGHNGFGYDPVFYVPGERRTAAEIDSERKRALSHRGQAFAALCERFAAERRGAP